MSYRDQIFEALRAGSLTAVRWLTAPLLVFAFMVIVGLGAYDYYVTRTLARETVGAVNSGRLLQILGQQQQAAAKQQQSVAVPK